MKFIWSPGILNTNMEIQVYSRWTLWGSVKYWNICVLTHVHAFVTLLNVMKFEHALLKAQVIAVKHYISLITIWCELSDGKVQFRTFC